MRISRQGIHILEQLGHHIELLITIQCSRCTCVQAHVRREQDGSDSDVAANAPSPEQPFPETQACHQDIDLEAVLVC